MTKQNRKNENSFLSVEFIMIKKIKNKQFYQPCTFDKKYDM